MTMREWWTNVSVVDAECVYGMDWETRQDAVLCGAHSDFRIHVRLKPDGAPKRYASEANRRAWETDEMWCQKAVDCGHDPRGLICRERP